MSESSESDTESVHTTDCFSLTSSEGIGDDKESDIGKFFIWIFYPGMLNQNRSEWVVWPGSESEKLTESESGPIKPHGDKGNQHLQY